MKKIVAILSLMILAISCSSKPEIDDRVVVKAGRLTMTVHELENIFSKSNFRGPEDEFDRKRKFLEQHLDRMIIADAGLEMGLGDSVEVDSAQEARILLGMVYKREVTDKLKLSEKEVRNFWKRYGGEIQAAHILVETKELADSLYDVARNAPDLFPELARKFSQDETTKDKGGDLGLFRAGKMVPEFEEAVFDLRPGELSRPVESPFGWHIIMMIDRTKFEPEDFMAEKGIYQALCSKYQRRKLTEKLRAKIKKRQHFKIFSETLAMLIDKSAELREASEDKQKASSAYLSVKELTPEEAQMPLASADESILTAGEFVEHLETKGSAYPFDLKRTQFVEQLIDDLLMPKMMYVYSKSIGLDQDPEYFRQREDTRNGFVYQRMESDHIQTGLTVSDEEVRDYYENSKNRYKEPEQVRVSEILVETEDEANEILRQLEGGADFSRLAGKTVRPGYAKKGGDLGYFGPGRFTAIYNQAVKMKKGEIGGPLQIDAKYAVFKVTGKKPQRQKKLSEVESQIRVNIMAKKKVENLKQWLDKRKKEVEHFIDVDLLRATLRTGKIEDES